MDEWMWRKIIEKMYDQKDFEILEQRFMLAIEDKKDGRSKSSMGQTKYLENALA